MGGGGCQFYCSSTLTSTAHAHRDNPQIPARHLRLQQDRYIVSLGGLTPSCTAACSVYTSSTHNMHMHWVWFWCHANLSCDWKSCGPVRSGSEQACRCDCRDSRRPTGTGHTTSTQASLHDNPHACTSEGEALRGTRYLDQK